MRDKGAWSAVAYASRVTEVSARGGTATYEGEDRFRQGMGLDPLIDPSKYDVTRASKSLLVPEGDVFILKFGVAMPVETDIDTTGSMGKNVDIAFRVQPKVQDLLIQGGSAVLRRYHSQIATGVVQDRSDQFPYERSQFEPDNEVERQMGLLVPERSGGDQTEDYQLGLFAATYLTEASIVEYGLRGYYFAVGDERGRDELEERVLKKVFGPSVLEKAFGKNQPQKLPSTVDVGKKLLESWHSFFLQVGANRYTMDWWSDVLGRERVIKLPNTEDLAEVQAVIIGLTEGALDLKSAVDFLTEARVSRDEAKRIVDACGQIPIGLQTTFPNFGKIPAAGAKFASREDIWPIGMSGASPGKKPGKDTEPVPNKEKEDWRV